MIHVLSHNKQFVHFLSGNEIIWNQIIRRSLRSGRGYPMMPEITFSKEEIVFNDYEKRTLYDESGTYTSTDGMDRIENAIEEALG